MAGHSKWHTTRHKKAALDAKRAKMYATHIKAIEVAARAGGPDLDGNPALEVAVTKAKNSRSQTTISTGRLNAAPA